MGAEALVGSTTPPSTRAARPAGNLTRAASLTAVASLLDYAVKIVVSLVVTPILVRGLGISLYGMWEMLARLGSYVSATDGRPTEALRLIIAQRQGDSDTAIKRRFVGAALTVWVIVLPLVIVMAAIFSLWLAPALTKAPPDMRGAVQLTCALIALCFILTSLGSVPESVLRGTNQGYRRMGLQSGLNILGGALAAGSVWIGMGLTGLGASQLIRAVVTAVCFLVLVRHYVPWFGADRPAWSEVKQLFGVSAWLTAGDAIARIMLASDVIILGAVVGPAAVASYTLTGYAARTAVGIHVFAAGAAIPGLGGVLGRGQMTRAAMARAEMLTLTWLFITIVGAAVLLWNKSFLALWVGIDNYAGLAATVLIVLVATQTAFIRTDAYIIDAALKPRQRVVVGALAAAITITLSIVLARSFGIVGLCAGVLAGRLTQSIGYPLMARANLGGTGLPGGTIRAARMALVTALLFTGAAIVGDRLLAPGWLTFITGVPLSMALIAAVSLTLGPGAAARQGMVRRLRSIRPGRGARPS